MTLAQVLSAQSAATLKIVRTEAQRREEFDKAIRQDNRTRKDRR